MAPVLNGAGRSPGEEPGEIDILTLNQRRGGGENSVPENVEGVAVGTVSGKIGFKWDETFSRGEESRRGLRY